MTDKKILAEKILNGEKWPEIYRPEFIEQLNNIADDLFSKKSIEGYISSLLIYHQITEEMIKTLINISNFYIQGTFIDLELKDKKLDGKMFGQLISELDGCLKLDGTNDFIKKCNDLNAIRIKIVHKLTKKTDINEISLIAGKSKKLFDEIFAIFDHLYDYWRLSLKDVKRSLEDNDEFKVEE